MTVLYATVYQHMSKWAFWFCCT